jgi:hypothetical protein
MRIGWILSGFGLAALSMFLHSCQATHFHFSHYTVSTDLPAEPGARFGMAAMADFDGDGDLDFSLSRIYDTVYIFEMTAPFQWVKHGIGQIPSAQLGGGAFDVDRDGWEDIVTGGLWYRNPQGDLRSGFQRYPYDTAIKAEIHDMVFADMNGDGDLDLVVMGDRIGCFWYEMPEDPLSGPQWEKHLITMEVTDDRADIHGGFFPGGVGDLDMDGDADVVMVGRWYRNEGKGESWSKQFLPFGSGGYWGLSGRSWIIDLDRDGDQDIVMIGCDQVDSRCAWLENNGNPTPDFKVHLLPETERGRRGSFHSLWVADFDMDGDPDIFTIEQEDETILPQGATMKAFIWENRDGLGGDFLEHVVLDKNIGGHDALFGDADGDGDLDCYFKIWSRLSTNGYGGKPHVDFLENRTIK